MIGYRGLAAFFISSAIVHSFQSLVADPSYLASNASESPAMAPASPTNGKPDTPTESVEGDASSDTSPIVSAPSAVADRNIVRRKLTGYVGFANLPNQWHRKSVRKGFNFNVMVVGEYTLSPEPPGTI